MPTPKDRSSMWWKDGWPGIVDGADWHRCIETGHYRFILDTESLTIPHIGAVTTKFDELPGAELGLTIDVDGKTYRCSGSEPFSRFVGPRLIESGKFLQRADVTGLRFTADDGAALNVEARFETIAWPDRLGLVLSARPGFKSIVAGEGSFGRSNGGFGLDGTNAFQIPADQAHTPAQFTVEFWVFLPLGFKAGPNTPWLLCKNPHEQSVGHYGLNVENDGKLRARINIGGGSGGAHSFVSTRALSTDSWNHVALSYDGQNLRLFVNTQAAGEKHVGIARVPKPGGLTFGNRQDQPAGEYPFRGVIDEVRLFDRALSKNEVRRICNYAGAEPPQAKPIQYWGFRADIPGSQSLPREDWGKMNVGVEVNRPGQSGGPVVVNAEGEGASVRRPDEWRDVGIVIDPVTLASLPTDPLIKISATGVSSGKDCPVSHERVRSWYAIDLDGIEPTPPPGQRGPSNDTLERVRLKLSNPTDVDQVARLLFKKEHIRQRIGSAITGVSAILRDTEGNPTGIPVQLSKNWHRHPEGGVYSGQWFHGISLINLPPKAELELELTIAYGHWGGVAAASHAQLSLIGWGGNQRWDQSALGSWGESICYEPEQMQAGSAITDVRPLMVKSKRGKDAQWSWTDNVGGGDFFRLYAPDGSRRYHAGMKADYLRHGPCLTEVTYHGRIAHTGISHRETVSLGRTDDLVCGTYRIRMDVHEPVDFSRFVIFQIGTDTYNPTSEKKMALGHAGGLIREWDTQPGGNVYRGEATAIPQRLPWASLHDVEPDKEYASTANRGIIVREWNAVLGGKPAVPHFAERGVSVGAHRKFSIMDLVPPPGVTQLLPGDYVEATIQHVIIPQFASDYYGPNAAHRASLEESGNTWQPVQRQVNGDDIKVEMKVGALQRSFPDVRIAAAGDRAEFVLTGGIGYVPITFTGLSSHKGHTLLIDGKPLDQSVHGNDFWQCDYDSASQTWSRTYNIVAGHGTVQNIVFQP